MNDPKLCQIVAVEKGLKSDRYARLSALHKTTQKPALYQGHSRTYKRRDEDGVQYNPEHVKVQVVAESALTEAQKILAELFDVTATKDYGNCSQEARADVVVNGKVLVAQAPVPFLLFLEKQLRDIKDWLEKVPVLDSAERWSFDPGAQLFKAEPTITYKQQKVNRAIVLYDATEKHPAQTQLVTEDQIVGEWHTEKHSGAFAPDRKRQLLDRVEALTVAVKHAREEANSAQIERRDVGAAVLSYLFGQSE